MKATGTVLASGNGKAEVQVLRENPCAACKGCAQGACHAEISFDHEPVTVQVTARDPLGVKVGDLVELYSDNRFTLGLAFVLFGLPLVIAVILGFFFGFVLKNSTWGMGTGVAAFFASFLILAFTADRISAGKNHTVITRILKESGR